MVAYTLHKKQKPEARIASGSIKIVNTLITKNKTMQTLLVETKFNSYTNAAISAIVCDPQAAEHWENLLIDHQLEYNAMIGFYLGGETAVILLRTSVLGSPLFDLILNKHFAKTRTENKVTISKVAQWLHDEAVLRHYDFINDEYLGFDAVPDIEGDEHDDADNVLF